MTDSLHTKMCDITLAERLGNRDVTRFDIAGIATYDDVRRIQAFCDAQNRTVVWTHHRHYGLAELDVVS